MKRLLIFGAGGHAKVAFDCAVCMQKYSTIDFMVDGDLTGGIEGHALLSFRDSSTENIKNAYDEVIVAIGDNRVRLKKSCDFLREGIILATLIHPSAIVSQYANVGVGTVVFAQSVINPFARVGNACIINTAAVVEHDCILQDGVHISPGVLMGGNVRIGETSWLCIGSRISNDVEIGSRVVVAAGSVVLHSTPNDVMVAGIPAVIRKKYTE